jgi:hypothetical protein
MKNRQKIDPIYKTPLHTIEQAKTYFREMGCSHYHMARDFPQRYEEYKKLNISRELEREWELEQFYEYYSHLMETADNDSLWKIHSGMYDLYEGLKTDQELMKLLEVTRHIRDKVPISDRVIVAETITGRAAKGARTGLIYKAYDSGHLGAAKEFSELSLHFSDCDEPGIRNKERCQRATELCNEIKLELGL